MYQKKISKLTLIILSVILISSCAQPISYTRHSLITNFGDYDGAKTGYGYGVVIITIQTTPEMIMEWRIAENDHTWEGNIEMSCNRM